MASFVDKIVSKFGTDKVLHYILGGWIVSAATPLGWWFVLVALVFLFAISVIKEYALDSEVDWNDIKAAMLGGATSTLIYLIIWIITLFVR